MVRYLHDLQLARHGVHEVVLHNGHLGKELHGDILAGYLVARPVDDSKGATAKLGDQFVIPQNAGVADIGHPPHQLLWSKEKLKNVGNRYGIVLGIYRDVQG